MKIRFTKDTYSKKESAIKGLSKAEWLEFDGNYNDVVYLYQSGHIINISDETETDTVILDLDELTDEQARNVHDIFYIMDLTEKLGVDHIEVFDSSSRKYNKQKMLIRTNMVRNIQNNKDLNYKDFRTKFENLTGIVTDDSMDALTQITFGININDSSFYTGKDYIAISNKSSQPTKKSNNEKVISESSNLLLSNTPINNKMDKSLITFEKGQYIPLNQIEYNKRYGKEIRFEGRFDWSNIHYVGYRNSQTTVIRNGNRHKTLGKLIKCVTYNALNQNNKYETSFGENDILTTVLGVIAKQFENHKEFLVEEGQTIKAEVHQELEYAKKMSLEDYYKEVSNDSKNKVKYKYTPRALSAKGLFIANIVFFETCKNEQAIMDKIGEIAEGDENTMKQIRRYYKSLVKGSIDSRKNNGHYADYNSYIESCTKNEKGKYIVSNSYYHNTKFRKWCKENEIKITKEV